ncbi:MAG TPA: diphthine--ammonia ligase [Bacteroidia bacterium]|nr:diphthine--ammonia ligase [Bacteroidia bacterium]
MMKEKVLFCWSGGKDSAMALHQIMKEGTYEVVALLTTFNSNFKRVSMHGVREELVEKQAEAIGLPLLKVYVSEGTNTEYENAMETLLLEQKTKGVTKVIFGDIFLEDLRAYREKNLLKVNLKAEFPLWKKNTSALIAYFLEQNFKTITCCVNDAYLGEDKVGMQITKEFIKNLPENVDPCGENGEYHTFCYDGPVFKTPVKFILGEKVYKPLEIKRSGEEVCPGSTITKGFWYCDLLPNN